MRFLFTVDGYYFYIVSSYNTLHFVYILHLYTSPILSGFSIKPKTNNDKSAKKNLFYIIKLEFNSLLAVKKVYFTWKLKKLLD